MNARNALKLPGCTPAPLMNYLKALGILRLVSEQGMVLREEAAAESAAPVLSAEERSLVSELVAEGLSIQEKFRPEPLCKQTAKGHYESGTLEGICVARKYRPLSSEL